VVYWRFDFHRGVRGELVKRRHPDREQMLSGSIYSSEIGHGVKAWG
jgi:hypothetical protein